MEKENIQSLNSSKDSRLPSQKIIIDDRKTISINAVSKVVSIKDDLAQLSTSYGTVMISGSDLQATKLDLEKGNVEISGKIDQIKFAEKNRENIFKRILK